MEKFQGKKLIVRIAKNVYQLNSIDELIKKVLGEQYGDLTQKEKLLKRYESMLLFSIQNEAPIVYSPKGIIKENKTFDNTTKYDMEQSIIIDDDITYFLSLCRLEQMQILEAKDADIFVANMDKSQIGGNYIVVNKFADKLLREYVEGVVTEEKTTDEK